MSEHHSAHHHHANDAEDPVEDSYSTATEEGAERLHRSWPALITTGFLGGVQVSVGVLAYILTVHETGNKLLGALAFSVGFIALYLAHSELFTEGFYYPIMAIFDGQGSWLELIRLWVVTLLSNLAGGWVTIGLVVVGLPELTPELDEMTHHFLEIGFSWQGAALAVLAGLAITLMTRMHAGTDEPGPTIAASVTGAFTLTGASLFHSVLDSIIMFGSIHAGHADVGYLDWLGWIWWVIPLNILGGLLFTTGPRLIRSREVRDDEPAGSARNATEPAAQEA